MKKMINGYFRLGKGILSFAIALSAGVGYYLAHSFSAGSFFLMFLGVYLLSMGASGLNEYYERETDKLMKRTASRPIPSGLISPRQALIAIALFIIIGSLCLSVLSIYALILGLINVVLYAFIYTPLKYKTNLATIPGGLVGAIPPLMGWYAAGQQQLSLGIIFFAAFMFLWQIPHFLILNLRFSEDYKKAGIATIVGEMSSTKFRFIFLIWTVCTVLISLLFPSVGLITQPIQLYACIIINIAVLLLFTYLVFHKGGERIIKGNRYMHLYLLVQFLFILFGQFAF
jgi:protoheme IX farnesyltransferase